MNEERITQDKCPTCGSDVLVSHGTTSHFIPIDVNKRLAEQKEEIIKMVEKTANKRHSTTKGTTYCYIGAVRSALKRIANKIKEMP